MPTKKKSFLLQRLKSILYAYKGASYLIRTEASIQIQLFIGVIVFIAGYVLEISTEEWLIQILCVGMVLGMEGINTAIEKLSDFVHPDYHKRIGVIKDISAGAVFFAAITAIIAGLIIYVPKLF